MCFYRDRANTRRSDERAAAGLQTSPTPGSSSSSTAPTVEHGKPIGDLNSVLAAVVAKKAGLVDP